LQYLVDGSQVKFHKGTIENGNEKGKCGVIC
jgi:hypothetical protein